MAQTAQPDNGVPPSAYGPRIWTRPVRPYHVAPHVSHSESTRHSSAGAEIDSSTLTQPALSAVSGRR